MGEGGYLCPGHQRERGYPCPGWEGGTTWSGVPPLSSPSLVNKLKTLPFPILRMRAIRKRIIQKILLLPDIHQLIRHE